MKTVKALVLLCLTFSSMACSKEDGMMNSESMFFDAWDKLAEKKSFKNEDVERLFGLKFQFGGSLKVDEFDPNDGYSFEGENGNAFGIKLWSFDLFENKEGSVFSMWLIDELTCIKKSDVFKRYPDMESNLSAGSGGFSYIFYVSKKQSDNFSVRFNEKNDCLSTVTFYSQD